MAQKFGYLFVDHRASPGIPEDKARKLGYEPALVGEGKLMEADTLTCAHCQTVAIKNPLRTRERHLCMKCGGAYICDNCSVAMLHPDYTHTPFVKVAELVLTGKPAILGSPQSLLKGSSNG